VVVVAIKDLVVPVVVHPVVQETSTLASEAPKALVELVAIQLTVIPAQPELSTKVVTVAMNLAAVVVDISAAAEVATTAAPAVAQAMSEAHPLLQVQHLPALRLHQEHQPDFPI
jgi:hypothetical protein